MIFLIFLALNARAVEVPSAAACFERGGGRFFILSSDPTFRSREILDGLDQHALRYTLVRTRDTRDGGLVSLRIAPADAEEAQGALDAVAEHAGVSWACDGVLGPMTE